MLVNSLSTWLMRHALDRKYYRPEIDGLRAIAVLSVIFYHLGFDLFQGGFIGVDIFFTISGYLISKKINNQIVRNEFILKQFYLNRFWRLFPALLTTLIICLLVSIIIFPTELLYGVSKSTFASLFSFSNFYFYGEIGYWDFGKKFKPLLHTWSLGLEEQFYLLFPLLLIVISRKFKNRHFSILLVISFLSIFLSTFITPIDQEATFYLLPFRFFEFTIGAFAYYFGKQKDFREIKNIFLIIVTLLLVTSIFSFRFIELFPSFWPLIPCFSTAVLLYNQNQLSSSVLGGPLLSYLGKLSYSLYLTHWPIIVLYGFYTSKTLIFVDYSIILTLTFTTAYLIYTYIEKPVRKNPIKPKKTILLCSLFLIAVCSFIYTNKGNIKYWTNDLEKLIGTPQTFTNFKRHEYWRNDCPNHETYDCIKISEKRDNILVLGDSHGIDGYNALRFAFPESNFILYSEKGCPPLKGYKQSSHCPINFESTIDVLSHNPEISHVVFSIRNDIEKIAFLSESINVLKNKYKVIVMGDGPRYLAQVRYLAYGQNSKEEVKSKVNEYLDPKVFEINTFFSQHSETNGYIYIDKLNYFCTNKVCDVFTRNNKEMVTYDRSHLSISASKELASYIRSNLKVF